LNRQPRLKQQGLFRHKRNAPTVVRRARLGRRDTEILFNAGSAPDHSESPLARQALIALAVPRAVTQKNAIVLLELRVQGNLEQASLPGHIDLRARQLTRLGLPLTGGADCA